MIDENPLRTQLGLLRSEAAAVLAESLALLERDHVSGPDSHAARARRKTAIDCLARLELVEDSLEHDPSGDISGASSALKAQISKLMVEGAQRDPAAARWLMKTGIWATIPKGIRLKIQRVAKQ